MKIIRFGQRVENCGGPMIHYLVGSSIKAIGLQCVQRILAQAVLPESNFKELLNDLNNYPPDSAGLTNALKVEYGLECKFVDNYAKGKIPGVTNSGPERFTTSIGMKVLFDPIKTRMEFAERDRFLFANFSKPFSNIVWPESTIETNVSFIKRLVSGNFLGQIIFDLLEPSVKSFAVRKSRENVDITATRILLALKIYKLRHGKLPGSLSELAPEFFSEIPIDDFDGKPFRYSPEKKIIYSVGPDLKDSGGKERIKYSKDYDLLFKIDF
ncbi:MAG TPA: hypothetical protein VFV23_08535 [Verrucomicrobiae bacterium]|nr:hypothetical protein [Verrucomicrobiae bacterium]